MKIWELDKNRKNQYKIVNYITNDNVLSKEIKTLTWSFISDGSLISNEGHDIGICFSTGKILNFEFENIKEQKNKNFIKF